MFNSGISLLLLVAVTYAAPRAHPIHQAEYQDPNPGVVSFWPGNDDVFRYSEPEEGAEEDYTEVVYDVKPFEGAVDVDFNVNPAHVPVLVNDSVTNAIFKDLEHRIAEDVQRMQQDMLFFRRLFGRDPLVPQMPSLFLPWGIPDDSEDTPDTRGPTGFDFNIFGRGDDDDDDEEEDEDDDDDFQEDDLFGGFPIIGIDRPLFSNLPEFPGVDFMNPADLPGNYSNETSVVHDVDGGLVQVNSTVNKASGNNFNTFFHHQVIHFKPDEEEGKIPQEEVPTSAPEVTEAPEDPATEAPVTEDQDVNEGTTFAPEGEESEAPASSRPPALPEVSPEISSANSRSESNDIPKEDLMTEEEDFEIANNLLTLDGMRKKEARSLRLYKPIVFPNDSPHQNDFPQSEQYSYHKSQEEDAEYDDAEVVYTDDASSSSRRRPSDLSKDTRVNYIQTGEGMAKPDPDAEIFNYGLVLEEERSSRRGQ